MQAARVAREEPPVDEVVVVGIAPPGRIVVRGRRLALAPPGPVAVPDDARVVEVAELARLDDALVRGLVDRVVVALVADLQDLPGLARGFPHALAAGIVPRHHLLAEHVLARLHAPGRDVGVHPQRGRHDDRLEVLLLEHVLPLGVMARRVEALLLEDLAGLAEGEGVDVGQREHVGIRGVRLLEQHPPLAAHADEAHPHRPSLDRALHGRAGSEGGERRRAREGLEEVAAAELLLLRGQVHEAASWAVATRAGGSWRRRSRPAIRPVRKTRRTSTAPASIRFLLTNRYAPSVCGWGTPAVGICEK